jgi:hypothetical protein
MSTKISPKSEGRDRTNRSYLEPHSFDRRVRDRNLTLGAIDQKGLDKYLSELVDVADRAEPVVTHPPGMPGGSGAAG